MRGERLPGAGPATAPEGAEGPSAAAPSAARGSCGPAAFALSAALWLAAWALAAHLVGSDLLLAGPIGTLSSLARSLAEPAFWSAVAYTASRIVGVGVVSAVVGTALGLAAVRLPWLEALLAPPLQVMKSAPVACVIVVVLVAWGAPGAMAAIIAFVALPPFYVAAREAQAARPRETEALLRLLGVARWRVALACSWPAMLPFFAAAAKTSIALSWRAGITAELLCVPLGSMGAGVYLAKLTLDSAALLGWTIVVMVLSWACERIAVALLRLTGESPRLALRGAPAEGEGHLGEASAQGASPLPALEVLGATVRFGERLVLDEVELRVAPGQRACLMAPTGSGKTTLVQLLAGQLQPCGGRVGAPRPLAAAFQGANLVEGLTACQNVELAARPGLSAAQLRAALAGLLPEGTLDQRPEALSGGTQRLVELARALLGPGDAVVLDEPFAGLDAQARERACAFVLEHLGGRALLVTTHSDQDAQLLGATVVRLGELQA